MHKTAIALINSAKSKRIGNNAIIHGKDHCGNTIRLYVYHKTCLAYINDTVGTFCILRDGWFTRSTNVIINQLISTLSLAHEQVHYLDDIGNSEMLRDNFGYLHQPIHSKLVLVAKKPINFDGIDVCTCGSTDIENILDKAKICNDCGRTVKC